MDQKVGWNRFRFIYLNATADKDILCYCVLPALLPHFRRRKKNMGVMVRCPLRCGHIVYSLRKKCLEGYFGQMGLLFKVLIKNNGGGSLYERVPSKSSSIILIHFNS